MSSPSLGFYTSAVIGIALALGVRCILTTRARQHLPPGPIRFPFVGNILQIPRTLSWVTFSDWAKDYGEFVPALASLTEFRAGDIIYLDFPGRRLVILNSYKASVDLLDKHSAKFSSRPRISMFELMNFGWSFVTMDYSERWREHRRVFHHFFNETVCLDYRGIQERCAHKLLHWLLRDPDRFLDHIRLTSADIILRTVYGIQVKDHDDQHLRSVETALDIVSEVGTAGRYLVESMPILKHVPSWFPGAGFKRKAAEGRVALDSSRDSPAHHAEMEKSSSSGPNIYLRMLSRLEEERESGKQSKAPDSLEDVAKNAAAMAHLAGSDTTLSYIQGLFLALTNYPEVQRMAQKELDQVVGGNRLPTFDDMQDLPYTTAVMKEMLRWHVVLPLGIGHNCTEDIEYEGYHIPKDTSALSNIWRILHDPELYSDPLTFNPSRWLVDTPTGLKLHDNLLEPDLIAFGYGRRICPGRFFARNTLFIITSNVLASFNLSPLDDAGNPAERVEEDVVTSGFLLYPKPFKASIVPRSAKAESLIKDAMM